MFWFDILCPWVCPTSLNQLSPLYRCPCSETVCTDPSGHWDGHDVGAPYPQAAEAEGKIRALAKNWSEELLQVHGVCGYVWTLLRFKTGNLQYFLIGSCFFFLPPSPLFLHYLSFFLSFFLIPFSFCLLPASPSPSLWFLPPSTFSPLIPPLVQSRCFIPFHSSSSTSLPHSSSFLISFFQG